MILCEQCGNEFHKGRIIEKEGQKFVQCPYCNYHNKREWKKKNKKRGIRP